MDDERFRLEIPLSRVNGERLEKTVTELILANQGRLLDLLFRRVHDGDARTTVRDDSLVIEDLSVDDDGGVVSVAFWTDYYAGCRDMNSDDEHQGELEFSIEGGFMIFDYEWPPIWRIEE